MSLMVRAAALTDFAEVARDCGLDARALVVEAGLPLRCLEDPDLKVSARAACLLLERAAERAGQPVFALRMVERRRLSNFGPLALLVRDAPTLRAALEAMVRHLHLHNEALSLQIEEVDRLVVLREQLLVGGMGSFRQADELVVGVTFRVLRLFLGAHWEPRLVCFSHPAPADTAAHRRLFGSAVEFGHDFTGLVCSAANLDAENPGADPVMARYVRQLVAEGPPHAKRFDERVRELVVLLLPRGHCRVDVVAQHLGMDRRTVCRRLADQGTSFSALVDQVRADLLERYRDEGRRPLAEVSGLLGFAAPSALSRWHRRRYGISARERASPSQARAS